MGKKHKLGMPPSHKRRNMPKIVRLKNENSNAMRILLALRYLSREAYGAGLAELAKNLREVEVKCDEYIEAMSIRNRSRIIPNETKELFPINPLVSKKAADMLESQLTDAFESALYQGMRPTDALRVILSWTSSEMMRIQLDQPASCQ